MPCYQLQTPFMPRQGRHITRLIDESAALYLTSYILLEASALIHRRLGFPALQQTMNSLKDVVTVVWVDRELHEEAWELLQTHGGQLSLVDCSAVVVAKRLEARVFAFDDHFKQEGLDYSLI